MRFIKITILILVLSSNLMLGQKTEVSIEKRCAENQPIELKILQRQPIITQTIVKDCDEFLPIESLETGAFFGFAAL